MEKQNADAKTIYMIIRVIYVYRKRMETAAGYHFNLPGHDVTDLTTIPIERVRPSNNDHIRRIRESLWITRYNALINGENKKKGIHS